MRRSRLRAGQFQYSLPPQSSPAACILDRRPAALEAQFGFEAPRNVRVRRDQWNACRDDMLANVACMPKQEREAHEQSKRATLSHSIWRLTGWRGARRKGRGSGCDDELIPCGDTSIRSARESSATHRPRIRQACRWPP